MIKERITTKELPQPKGKTNLASLIMESHGKKETDYQNIIVTQNFVAGGQLLPGPEGDKYLSGTSVPILGEYQTTAVFTQPPGLLEWHADHTMPEGAQVIELNPVYGPNGEIGYPYGDINTQLQLAIEREEVESPTGKTAYMTTFPDESFQENIDRLNVECIQESNPADTNNKTVLREMAYSYQINMTPGMVIRSEEDIQKAVQLLGDIPEGAWMKVPTGSGGDLVQKIKPVNEDAIRNVRLSFADQINQALAQGNFSEQFRKEYEINGRFSSSDGFVIESDVRNHAQVIANCSNVMRNSIDGSIEMMGVYGQMTGNDGSFIGSRSLFDLPQIQRYLSKIGSTKEELEQYINLICGNASRYMRDLGYYGPYGQDFFLVEKEDHTPDIYFVEFNGRLPISGIGEIMKRNAGVSSFINTNIWRKNGQLDTMVDLKEALTLDGKDLTEADPKDGAVYVQAMRAEWTRQNGEMELVRNSNAAKVLFLGDDPQKLDWMQQQLAVKNGISYQSL
ncbi:MAG TPA: hypothetical protein PLS49_00695 [Candidatus Woesebacteria bacterium]|nr:hypothetical protein [Candidatus Woesebacteria bacterium]